MLQEGQKLGYDTEAFAIYDTMNYVKPPIHTLCVGNAWGEAALLLSSGEKVQRAKTEYIPLLSHKFCYMLQNYIGQRSSASYPTGAAHCPDKQTNDQVLNIRCVPVSLRPNRSMRSL